MMNWSTHMYDDQVFHMASPSIMLQICSSVCVKVDTTGLITIV